MTRILITYLSTCIKNILNYNLFNRSFPKSKTLTSINVRKSTYNIAAPYHKLTKNSNEEKFQKGTDVCVYCINKTILGD